MDALDFREPASAWTHAAGLALALVGTPILWRRAVGAGKRVSLLVYGLALIACYAASTLYHAVRVPTDRLGIFLRMDNVGIFALIAGSYTPFAWNLLRGPWRAVTLTAVWGATAAAVALIASGRGLSLALATCVYLAMGWGVVACYGPVARVVPRRALLPVAAGGLLYSVGAALNLLGWPALWPGSFGAHELFHLFVIAGSLAHYRFILRVIAPFGSEARPSAAAPGSVGLRAPGAWSG